VDQSNPRREMQSYDPRRCEVKVSYRTKKCFGVLYNNNITLPLCTEIVAHALVFRTLAVCTVKHYLEKHYTEGDQPNKLAVRGIIKVN